MTPTRSIRVLAAAMVVTLTGIASALAAGGSHSDAVPPAHVCKTGYVYSEKSNKCVKVTAGLLTNKELFLQGRSLAKAGHFQEGAMPEFG